MLVAETNRYAATVVGRTPRARPWHDVVVPEMKAFVGILILMGIIKLPRLELYWSQKYPQISTPGISAVMPLVRFEQLFRCLHLNDNSSQVPRGTSGHDRLFKVRKLLNLVVPRFQSEYVMHQECSIDEAMIPFKGRLGFKQYMRNKPIKWGIKVFVLADATNGYVRNLQVYTGKSIENDGHASVGLCSRVVLDMMFDLHHSGLHLYTDNFYTSPLLYLTLYNKGINACGTCRPNRSHFPPELICKATKHNSGHYDYRSNGPLLACVWVDKRTIYFLSTIHVAESSGAQPSVKRRRLDGSQKDVPCPPVLPDYQTYMRGVDRGDQLQTYYNIGRHSTKWWKRVFFYLVECAILNSYVMDGHLRNVEHTQRGRKKRDVLQFRLELASELIGGFSSRKSPGRSCSTELERLNGSLGHWPVHVKNKLDCVVCSAIICKKHLPRSKNRHESRIQCSHCKVHLCVAPGRDCFLKYHKLSDYTQ